MTQFQLTAIRLSSLYGGHEHITHARTSGGTVYTREEIIVLIDGGMYGFYTSVNGKVALVRVRRNDGNKAPYIQTQADGYWNDNLLALPRF